jgi:hypothetical protein
MTQGPLLAAGVFGTVHPLAVYPPQSLEEAAARRLVSNDRWFAMVGDRFFQGFGPRDWTAVYPYVSYYIPRKGVAEYGFEDNDRSQLIYLQFSIFAEDTVQSGIVADILTDCFDPARPENDRSYPQLAWTRGACRNSTHVGGPTTETEDRGNPQKTVIQQVDEWCFDVYGRP